MTPREREKNLATEPAGRAVTLLLDVGNTLLKWRAESGGSALDSGAVARRDWRAGLRELARAPAPSAVWVASVAGPRFESALRKLCWRRWRLAPWFARTGAGALGLANGYREPARLGVDRWLAMLAGWRRAGGAVCVVDAGSALTIDFVSAAGQHLGGHILPGLASMERALLRDTERVRWRGAPRGQLLPGASTGEAVRSGLLLSQAGAVALALQRAPGEFALLLTGGDGRLLLRELALGGEYADQLVLDGLRLLGAQRAPGREPPLAH